MAYWWMTCAILVPGTLYASWVDYSEKRVPNWLNATLLCAGLATQAAYFGWSGLATGFGGALMGFGLLIVPWLMHGMGAGDVKLMAAIGAWFGPVMTFYAFAVGAVLGGMTAIAMIVSSHRMRHAYANLGVILNKCTNRATLFSDYGSAKSFGATSQLLPYGVPLTAGSLLVLTVRLMTL